MALIAAVRPEIALLGPGKSQQWSVGTAERIIAYAARNLTMGSPVNGGEITAEFIMNELSDPEAMAAGIAQWMGEVSVNGTVAAGDRLVAGPAGVLVSLSGLAKAGKLSHESPQTIMFGQGGRYRMTSD